MLRLLGIITLVCWAIAFSDAQASLKAGRNASNAPSFAAMLSTIALALAAVIG